MRYLLSIILLTTALVSEAQITTWLSNTPGTGVYNNGLVAIGLNTARTPLHIRSSSVFYAGGVLFENSSATSAYNLLNSSNNFFIAYNSNAGSGYPQADYQLRFYIGSNGNVGIGTTTPQDVLHVNGSLSILRNDGAGAQYISFRRPSDGATAARIGQLHAGTYAGHLIFETNDNNGLSTMQERMRITASGNVLIGRQSMNNTSYLLDVNGKMHATEIVINLDGADFVFADTYSLPTLAEVEKYVTKHKHLPEIQSAQEMQKDGVEIGKMETKLLQKIEELTLYMIDLNKKVESLTEENERLKVQMNSLKKGR